MTSFKQLLQSKEEQIQRKRKTLDETTERKPKRRRQSRDSSEESVLAEDEKSVSASNTQTLSEISEESEDNVLDENASKVQISESDVKENTKRKEKKNLEMRIEVCEFCGTREGRTQPCTKCRLVFHPECLRENTLVSTEEPFLCLNCDSTITLRCILCQSSEGDALLSCNVKSCSRRYHRNCLKMFHSPTVKQERPPSQFTCPVHVCHTCVAELNELHHPEKKLVRCIYCPTAYHQSNFNLSEKKLTSKDNLTFYIFL